MKLLLCSMTVPWPNRPAQGAYHLSQARAVHELGHAMEIFSPAPALPTYPSRWFAAGRRHLERPMAYKMEGVSIFSPRVPFAFPNVLRTVGAKVAPRLTNQLTMLLAGTLRCHCKARAIEGILAHGVFPWGLVCTRVASDLDIPLCFIEHSAEDVFRLDPSSNITRHCQHIYRQAKAVFVVGRPMQDHITRVMPDVHVQLVPNGVSPAPVGLGMHRKVNISPRVLAACHYYRRKGLEELVEAWPAVLAKHPGAVLEIHTNAPSSLRQLVMQSAARDSIELQGMIPAPELRLRMAEADLFALPSRGEAFGLVYAEALSVGTPVLMSQDCGLAAEVSQEHCSMGYVVAECSAKTLADAINKVLSNPGDLRQRGLRGKKHVDRHYTWQANASAVIGIFEKDTVASNQSTYPHAATPLWSNHAAENTTVA